MKRETTIGFVAIRILNYDDIAGGQLHSSSNRRSLPSVRRRALSDYRLLFGKLPHYISSAVDAERAILQLKVCDPACGSGHFLIAAAHRIARRLAAVRTGDAEASPDAVRHALRDLIGHCVYGVDVNEMAVELCKVSLWLEALERQAAFVPRSAYPMWKLTSGNHAGTSARRYSR